MNKLLWLCMVFWVVGLAAGAQEAKVPTFVFHVQGNELSEGQLEAIWGGQHADMDGSYGGYGPYDRLVERDMSTRPTEREKEMARESLREISLLGLDVVAAAAGVFGGPISRTVAGAYGLARAGYSCTTYKGSPRSRSGSRER